MTVAVASGYPQHSGTFIPEIWDQSLLIQYYAQLVMAQITMTEHTEKIKNVGDTVNVRTRPTFTWHPYTKGMDMFPDNPEAPVVQMTIDRAGYFYYKVDNIDKYQSDINMMDDWAEGAVQDSKIAIETEYFADIYADAHASNIGLTAGAKTGAINLGTTGSPITLTKQNVLEKIIACGVVLSEQNVPDDRMRYGVMPPYALGLVALSDIKDASLSGDGQSTIRTGAGRVGRVGNFEIYETNLLAQVTDGTDTCYNLMFGHKKAVAFVIQNIELVYFEKLERTSGQANRCLQAYDWKAFRPESLSVLYAKFAANEM